MLTVRLARPGVPGRPVEAAGSPAQQRLAGGRLTRTQGEPVAVLDVSGLHGASLSAFVEGLALGAHRLPAVTGAPRRVELAGTADEAALRTGLAAAETTIWARLLANTPAAVKTPAWLAERAVRELEPLGVPVKVHGVDWLRENGFGGVLAVGGGAAATPRFVHASWRPRGARTGVHPVLVGKGITFDTGGLNRKPGDSMRTMHTDMSGGAAVLAALRAIAHDRVPVRVTALVPIAENALGAASYRPGDVVRHYGGRTSEIGNTDAEGRIVLADALAWAVARLRPTALVDIATLTGAAKVALGLRTAGLFATSTQLANALERAGADVGEPVWQLPLSRDYEPMLRSDIADANNAPGNPGAITAALFLRPFAGSVPWAHLDVAGPARAPEDDGILTRGATGFGARLLHEWVRTLA